MVDPDSPPRDPRLLDELQAIRELLNDRDNAGVPLLRDVVTPGAVPLLNLNDIFEELAGSHPQPELDEIGRQAAAYIEAQGYPVDEQSFPADGMVTADEPSTVEPSTAEPGTAEPGTAEPGDAEPVRAADTAAAQPHPPENWQRELLIQEVVDDFIPHIEAALRRRLLAIDNETLRSWLRE